MIAFKKITLILLCLTMTACSAKMRAIVTASAIGGVVGGGLGYTVIHSGAHQQYRTQNTIVSASVLAAVFGLATWYHENALEEERVELAGKFSRATYLDRDVKNGAHLEGLTPITLGKQSVKLDEETRWVLPEFAKRINPAERSDNELVAPHHTWEIVRPGFFLMRDQDPDLFKSEEQKK